MSIVEFKKEVRAHIGAYVRNKFRLQDKIKQSLLQSVFANVLYLIRHEAVSHVFDASLITEPFLKKQIKKLKVRFENNTVLSLEIETPGGQTFDQEKKS